MSQIQRSVEVYVSSSRARKVITSNATTWGQLRNDILAATNLPSSDLSSDNSKIFEGNQRVELVSDETQLPTNIRLEDGTTTNNLLIVITPKAKVKSGAVRPRTEIYAELNQLFTAYGETARNFFSGYTRISSEDLERSIVAFKARLRPAQQVQPVQAVAITASSIMMIKTAFNLLAQATELIKGSGLTSDIVDIKVDTDVARLEAIAQSLNR